MSIHIAFPEPANRFAYALIAGIRRVLLLPKCIVLRHVVLQGTTHHGATGYVMNYFGDGETLDYLKDLVFSNVTRREQSLLPIWGLRRQAESAIVSDQMVVVELNAILSRLSPDGGYCMSPWIRQKIFLNGDRYRRRRRQIEHVYGRKVRKYGYEWRITRAPGALATFYDDFYVPYISSRYPDNVWIRGYRELKNAMKCGFLLQIYDGDRWISGGVCRVNRGELETYAFGLVPDYSYHLRRGALSAFYYFVVKWAKDHDIGTIDLRRCRPNTDDGVFVHKRRWGAEPVKDIWCPSIVRIFGSEGSDLPRWYGNQSRPYIS